MMAQGSSERFIWFGSGLASIALAVLFGIGADLDAVLTGLVLTLLIAYVGIRMAGEADKDWLPRLVVIAFLVKLVGAGARYYVLRKIYFSGDALGYHGFGSGTAPLLRVLDWEAINVNPPSGGPGTKATKWATTILYLPHVPTLLGGFFMFAGLGFIGQLSFYAAFRRAVSSGRLKIYAVLVFFAPTLIFWPSSPGKDSLLLLFLGLGSFAVAAVFTGQTSRGLVLMGLAGIGMMFIRPHMLVLLGASAAVALLMTRARASKPGPGRRLVLLISFGLGVVLLLPTMAETLKFDLSQEGVEEFLDDQERNTFKGGSAIEGSAVTGLADIPEAAGRVVLRPFPQEAESVEQLLSSLEGMLLLAILLWRVPVMIRRVSKIRGSPYLAYALSYTLLFIVAFSAILNLGILARQRSQVYPLLLAVLVGLGWEEVKSRASIPEPATPAGLRAT